MVLSFTHYSSDSSYLYVHNFKNNVLPSKFSMLVVLGYASALTVIPGKLMPQYEFLLN